MGRSARLTQLRVMQRAVEKVVAAGLSGDSTAAAAAVQLYGQLLHGAGRFRRALAARVPAQLSWEAYMRCGMGLCGSCERDGVLLCCEGPVVAAKPDGPDGAGGSE